MPNAISRYTICKILSRRITSTLALFRDAQIYGGIPFLSAPNFAWGNRGFNFKDFGLNRPTRGTVDYAQARANSSQMNYATADASFEIVNLGYRHQNHFFTFGLTDYLGPGRTLCKRVPPVC